MARWSAARGVRPSGRHQGLAQLERIARPDDDVSRAGQHCLTDQLWFELFGQCDNGPFRIAVSERLNGGYRTGYAVIGNDDHQVRLDNIRPGQSGGAKSRCPADLELL